MAVSWYYRYCGPCVAHHRMVWWGTLWLPPRVHSAWAAQNRAHRRWRWCTRGWRRRSEDPWGLPFAWRNKMKHKVNFSPAWRRDPFSSSYLFNLFEDEGVKANKNAVLATYFFLKITKTPPPTQSSRMKQMTGPMMIFSRPLSSATNTHVPLVSGIT